MPPSLQIHDVDKWPESFWGKGDLSNPAIPEFQVFPGYARLVKTSGPLRESVSEASVARTKSFSRAAGNV